MMSLAEGVPGILLPADPSFREARERDNRLARLRRGAIATAALAHLLVIAAVIVHWPALFAEPIEQPPIPVTLVMVPPPPPPAAPPVAATPAPPPPPPPQHELVSGPDTQTTAPPKPAEKAEDAGPKPEAPPPVETRTGSTEAPPPKTEPAPQLHPPKPKVATREATPKPSHGSVNRAPGDVERAGDPYLNHLWAMIEEHRNYPADAIGPLGLRLEGTAVYLIAVRSDGALAGVKLERSSGADVLDEAALKMIQEAAPFPPPPPNEFPAPGVVLEVTIHLFPGAG